MYYGIARLGGLGLQTWNLSIFLQEQYFTQEKRLTRDTFGKQMRMEDVLLIYFKQLSFSLPKYKLTPVIFWKTTTSLALIRHIHRRGNFCVTSSKCHPSPKIAYTNQGRDFRDKIHVSGVVNACTDGLRHFFPCLNGHFLDFWGQNYLGDALIDWANCDWKIGLFQVFSKITDRWQRGRLFC